MGHWLDDAARGLNEGALSRRHVLRRAGSAAVGGLFAFTAGPLTTTTVTALAGRLTCKAFPCLPPEECCHDLDCWDPTAHEHCCLSGERCKEHCCGTRCCPTMYGKEYLCCPPAVKANPDHACYEHRSEKCCPSGQICLAHEHCCGDDARKPCCRSDQVCCGKGPDATCCDPQYCLDLGGSSICCKTIFDETEEADAHTGCFDACCAPGLTCCGTKEHHTCCAPGHCHHGVCHKSTCAPSQTPCVNGCCNATNAKCCAGDCVAENSNQPVCCAAGSPCEHASGVCPPAVGSGTANQPGSPQYLACCSGGKSGILPPGGSECCTTGNTCGSTCCAVDQGCCNTAMECVTC